MMKEKLKKIIFLILCVAVYLLAVWANGGHFVFIKTPFTTPTEVMHPTMQPFDR